MLAKVLRVFALLLTAGGICGQCFAYETSITVTGVEQNEGGTWDQAQITLSFTNSAGTVFTEVLAYGQFSTPQSIASAIGAKFSRDYGCQGVFAYATGATVNFYLGTAGGILYGPLTVSGLTSSSSFHINAVGWQIGTAVSLTSNPNPVSSGYNLTLSASVTAIGGFVPTGTVTLMDGTTSIGTAVTNNGSAIFHLSTLSVGTHSITAMFAGGTGHLGSTSAPLSEVVSPVPTVSRIYPDLVAVGAQVTIQGEYFETSGTVMFNGMPASVVNWASNSITAIVPAGATSGIVTVQNTLGSSSGTKFFVLSQESSYQQTIAINHSLVKNTDQSDFPVLISGTYSFLADALHRGNVKSHNGYDIVFTSDAAGQNRLDHEIERYDGTTGSVSIWVKVPTLSHLEDTTIYLWYGTPGVTISQENKPGVWANGYAAVYHLTEKSGNVIADSTGINNGTAIGVVPISGQIAGAQAFGNVGTASFIDVPSNSTFKSTGQLTVEAWANPQTIQTHEKIISLDCRSDGTWSSPYSSYSLQIADTSNQPAFQLTIGGVSTEVLSYAPINANSWQYLAGTYDGTDASVYLNGLKGQQVPLSGQIDYGSSRDLAIGARSIYSASLADGWKGYLDEVRISSVARTADWIATQYNNQSEPSQFYVMGASVGGYASVNLSPFVRTYTVNHAKVPNTDQVNFPVLIAGANDPIMKGVSFGGHIANINAYDVIFSSDALGQNRLNYEIDTYDPTAGTYAFWVQVPNLSHTNDTTLYMWYGNPAITTSQENQTGVWSNGYVAVYHMGNGYQLSSGLQPVSYVAMAPVDTTDSTGINNGVINYDYAEQTFYVAGTPGLIGAAATPGGPFFGQVPLYGPLFLDIGDSGSLKPANALTVESWVSPMRWYANVSGIWTLTYPCQDGTIAFAPQLNATQAGSWQNQGESYGLTCNSNNLSFGVDAGGTLATASTSTSSWIQPWSFVAGSYTGSSVNLYVNGSLSSQVAASGSIVYGADVNVGIGGIPPSVSNSVDYLSGPLLLGSLDEVRISSVARSSDWIAAEYNNVISPSTFANVGSELVVPNIGLLCSPSRVESGQTIGCTAQLPSGASGTVAFSIGGTPWTIATLGSTGSATTMQPGLGSATVGTYVVTAVYPGDTQFASVTRSVNVQVISAPVVPRLAVACNPNVVVQGNSAITCVANIALGATGTAAFSLDGVAWTSVSLDSSGNATASNTLTTAAVGSHSISISYSGDSNFAPGTAATHVVIQASSGPPVISGLSFRIVSNVAQVVVRGSNFGGNQGTSQLLLNGSPLPISGWANNSISATLGSGTTSGNLTVTVNGISSNAAQFVFSPAICP